MSGAVKVSVVTPVYNAGRCLTQCLESLAEQTLREIEFICVDDGSTDGSSEILRRFAERDGRFAVVRQENRGLGAAMNAGMRRARGEYLGILESDDYAEPGMFETLYAAAKRERAEVVKSDCWYRLNGREFYSPSFERYSGGDGFLEPRAFTNAFYVQRNWTGLYRRDFLLRGGIWHNETPGAAFQDVSFNFLVMSRLDRFYYLRKPLMHYRADNPDSSVHSRGKTFALMDECACIERWLRNNADEDELWEILANLRFRLYQREARFRVDEAQLPAFLERAVGEYRADREAGRYARRFWDEEDWTAAQRILAAPEDYLDRVRRLLAQREAERRSLLGLLREEKALYLYGAGEGARRLRALLRSYGLDCAGYAVREGESAACGEAELPVCTVEQLSRRPGAVLLVAVRGPVARPVRTGRTDAGFRCLKLDAELLSILTQRLDRALPRC